MTRNATRTVREKASTRPKNGFAIELFSDSLRSVRVLGWAPADQEGAVGASQTRAGAQSPQLECSTAEER
jgi:hypothetical protein